MADYGIQVGVEAGAKRVFACALDWPGWCRSGRDEAAALEALTEYGPRYATVLRGSGVRFPGVRTRSAIAVVERTDGNATTDFGAPDGSYESDDRPLDRRALTRMLKLLDACWSAFDDAVEGAAAATLRKGPRGGGRELGAIVDHVVDAESSYARMVAVRVSLDDRDRWAIRASERAQIREGLKVAVLRGMPEAGPRGGKRWTPRRFLRRAAWHVLDHAWEIEDRVERD